MEEAEILELIREHLTISVEKVPCWDYGSTSQELKISLLLSGEVISYESVYIEVK